MFVLPFLKDLTNSHENVLLVNLSLPLGDFVSRINFINGITLRNTETRLYLVCDARFKPLSRFFNKTIQVIFIDTVSYKYNPLIRIRVLNELRKLNLNSAFNISVDRGMISDEVTTLCGAYQKIGILKKNIYLSKTFEKINNVRYTNFFAPSSFNEYEIMDQISGNNFYGLGFALNSNVGNEKKVYNSKYVVIAPFASKKNQSWPLHKYLLLADGLASRINVKLIGMPFLEETFNNQDITNLTGKSDIGYLFDLIKEASLFIGNDSGLTHVAMLFNTPSIVLLGGGAFEQFFPNNYSTNMEFIYKKMKCYNCNWNCRFATNICLTEIDVNSVSEIAEKTLDT